jgi:hypothetical protein
MYGHMNEGTLSLDTFEIIVKIVGDDLVDLTVIECRA